MKRLLDVVIASVIILITLPVQIIVSIIIPLTSKGPVFYRAKRAGLFGKPYDMLKYRTMVMEADKGSAITTSSDRRVTWIGRLLRVLKIDEIPQFYNVLLGQMSIVGPRPEDQRLVKEYYNDEDMTLLDVRPGITCLGQIYYYMFLEDLQVPEGENPEKFYAEKQLPIKLAYDKVYVSNQSFFKDLYLIWWTFWIIILKIFNSKPRWSFPTPVQFDLSPREKKI